MTKDKGMHVRTSDLRWHAARRFLRREVSFKLPVGILLTIGAAQFFLLLLALD